MTDATSSRRIEANRANSLQSTGSRSAAGKERSKFNALKHGMGSKTAVLPGEDPAVLRARLRAAASYFKC